MLLLAETQPTPSPLWIPLAVAAIPLLGVMANTLGDWWKKSNRDARRLRLWDEAKKATEYWDARLKLIETAAPADSEPVNTARQQTLLETERIRRRVMASMEELAPTPRPRVSLFSKALLLYPTATQPNQEKFRSLRKTYWLNLFFSAIYVPLLYSLHQVRNHIPLPYLLTATAMFIAAILSWYIADSRYREGA